MKSFFYISLCILPACFSSPVLNSVIYKKDYKLEGLLPVGIIGGKKIDITKVPYQVAIKVNGTFEGSGIIIGKKWVATIASVVLEVDPNDVSIVAGESDYTKGSSRGVEQIIIHPEFEFFQLLNDIALIKLKSNLKYSKKIKSIKIGTSALKSGSSVTLSGWGDKTSSGRSSSNQLTRTTVNIVDTDTCKSNYIGYTISSSMICAFKNNSGPCWNDFGDVITYKDKKAYGLFSWAKGCDVNDYPGVYTDLVSFSSWIRDTINNASSTTEPRSLSEINKENLNIIQETKNEELALRREFSNMQQMLQKINTAGIMSHRISKRDADSSGIFFLNDGRNVLEEIEDAIKIEEREENIAEQEEKEQEQEEDKAEEEALEMIKNLVQSENLYSENEKIDQVKEIERVEEGRQMPNERNADTTETFIQKSKDEVPDEVEDAIRIERTEEANADQQEEEQEIEEDEAEKKALEFLDQENIYGENELDEEENDYVKGNRLVSKREVERIQGSNDYSAIGEFLEKITGIKEGIEKIIEVPRKEEQEAVETDDEDYNENEDKEEKYDDFVRKEELGGGPLKEEEEEEDPLEYPAK